MRLFWQLFGQYIKPYHRYISWGVIANIGSAILNLLSFSLLMPILRILFGMEQGLQESPRALSTVVWSNPTEWGDGVRLLGDYFNYYITQLIATWGPTDTLLLLCIYLVVMTLVKVAVTYGGIYALIPIRTGVVRDMRNALEGKLLRLPLAFMSDERKGDLLARISGDVNEIEYSVVSMLESIIKNPILIVIYLTALFVISWQLTLFVLIVLPIAGYIMGLCGRRLKRDSLDSQTLWGRLMSMVEESLSGLRIVQAFTAEQRVYNRFSRENDRYRRLVSRVYARQGLAHPVSELLGTLTIAIILWYGGSLIFSGHSLITADAFIYYLVIFYSIINPAKELSRSTYSIQKGIASMERINGILGVEERILDPVQPQQLTFHKGIRYEGVSFRYGDAWVLRNLDLTIAHGQMIALVGASGAGKSTLVDLLPRFHDVTEGRITIDGTDIRDVRLSNLRSMIAYVSQVPILFNDTIRNNITFGMEGEVSDEALYAAARAANALEFIEQIPEGFDFVIGDGGSRLSGGQRQRLSIARALLKDSPILILDEATSALDNASERLVQEAIDRLVSDRTTIVIAHRLSTILHADHICVLQSGRIIEQGTHDALLALGGSYAHLYQIQFNQEAN